MSDRIRKARDPRKVSEAAVLKAVKQLLEAKGFRIFRRTVLAVHAEHKGKKRFVPSGKPGMADLWGWIAKHPNRDRCGIHIEVEVKALGKTIHRPQSDWLEWARCDGCIAFWCDSVEMAEAKLKEWGL